MYRNRWIAAGLVLGLSSGGFGLARAAAVDPAATSPQAAPSQAPAGRGAAPRPIENPHQGDPEAIRLGSASYQTRCASCHGADATGDVRGSDLTGLWAAGFTDVQVFQAARRGVPNTLLPHSFGPDADIWAILAYLRTLKAAAGTPSLPEGDATTGAGLFRTHCSSCHQVNGGGGRLGPDLSRVGSSRSRALIAHKIRNASSYIFSLYEGGYVLDGYQPVQLVTRDGQTIRGVKKNEDAFSVQIMDAGERVRGYRKSDLREFVNDTTSLMPAFGRDRLSDGDLNHLLSYLGTLRDSSQKAR